MIKKIIAAILMSISGAAAVAVPFGSQSVLVVEEGTGKVLLEKNAHQVVSIASLTKLMTAMVVLDAKQDMHELIAIEQRDVDIMKHSTSRVPVGSRISRADVLQLALMSSDNRAAASLARTFDGGVLGFKAAVRAKIAALGMTNTVIEEPTGLSPNNKSTAQDLIKMAEAAATYPQITEITTQSSDLININGRNVEYRNTNRLVGAQGWDIGLSKTGYTEEAGKCLIMRIRSAGKNATLVLLNANASSARIMDALNIRRFISGEQAPVARVRQRAAPRPLATHNAPIIKAGLRTRVKASRAAKPAPQMRRRRA
jgi:D-alanyl-D-alanine carboxypeptidase/D-alanyl-D-alanine endopeptidase (penicillin-binding protein 7)